MSISSLARASVLVAVMSLPAVLVAPPVHAQDLDNQSLSVSGAGALVGIDAAGRATAVWVDQPSRSAIRYAVRPPGSSFGFVRAVGGVASVSELGFAESSSGRAVVVWTEYGRLKAAVRTGPTSDFGPGRVIGGGDTAASAAHFPDVAVSDSGRAVVSWVDGTDGVHAALANGAVFGPDVLLEPANNDLEDPAAGIDATGAALVVWEHRGATTFIRGASAPAGAAFGAATSLVTLPGQSFTSNPELAVNAGGAALLAYVDGNSVVARAGDVTGAMGAPQPVAGPPAGSALNQQVALDPSGRGAVVLSLTDAGESPLMGAVSDVEGTFGPLQTISAGSSVAGPSIGEESVEVAAGGGGFSVFFANDHDGDGVTNEPYVSTTADGVFGAPHRLSPDDPNADFRVEVHGARDASGRSVAVWSRWDGEKYVVQAAPVTPDTVAPRVRNLVVRPQPYEAGRGRLTISFTTSEEARATVVISRNGTVVRTLVSGVLVRPGQSVRAQWNGKRAGKPVAPGRYSYRVKLVDAAGNRGGAGGFVRVT